MSFKTVWYFISSALIVSAALEVSANSTGTISAPVSDAVATAPSKSLGIDLSLVSKSSLHRPDDPSKTAATELWIGPNLKIANELTLSGLAVVTRDFENREEPQSISNAKITLARKPIELNRMFQFQPAVIGRMPTNREAREDDRLRGALGIEPRLLFASGRVAGLYRIAISKNVHEQTLDRNGSPNIEWVYGNTLKISYKLIDKVSVTASGDYSEARTYRNFTRTKFDLSEELNVDAGGGFSVDLGHSNGGDAMKPNLQDSNIALFNEQGSVIYLGVNYVY